MNKEEVIKKIKDSYKLNETVAEEIYTEANSRLQLFKTQGITDEKELDKRFNIILSSMLIKRVNSRAEDYEGIFFMDSGVISYNENKIKKTLEAFAKNPMDKEKFLASGEVKMIGDKPVVIDMEEEKFDKKNPNYGKPLKVDSFRQLDGIIKTIKNDKPVMEKIVLRCKGETVNEIIPLMRIVKFRAGKYEKAGNSMLFLESGTVIVDERAVENIMDIALSTYKNDIIDVNSADERYSLIAQKKAKKTVVIKGIIDSINLTTDKPSIMLRDDISFEKLVSGGAGDIKRLMVKIPSNFDGAPFSECLVFGDLWRVGKEEGKELLGMTAKGFICPTKAVVPETIDEVDIEDSNKKGADEKW